VTKPGIIRGNAITATAGFLLASAGNIDLGLYLGTIVGLSLIIASGCVFNNFIDRGIDKKMKRTKNRALVTGQISAQTAVIYGIVLGLLGALCLYLFSNNLALFIALFGLFMYVVVYGIAKRRTVHGTVVGSVSGAIPPVVGYVAASNSLDSGAQILFLILVCWQMPHFYAIAIYRMKEYAAAGIPVLPIKEGIKATKIQIMLYIAAFVIATSLLTVFGYTGYTYLAVAAGLGLGWFRLGLKGFNTGDSERWARKMFGFSLLVIMLLSVTISIDTLLP
jgi:heme o synthase